MSDPVRIPPPHVQTAERVIADYRNSLEHPSAPRRDIQREWAIALDRARQHDQSKMPPWRDPRR
jgi:hypothetical protein